MDQARIRRARRHDRLARWIITLGGVTVIASVVAILLLIVSATFPLFRPARSHSIAWTRLPESLPAKDVVGLGVEVGVGGHAVEAATAYTMLRDGTIRFLDLRDGVKVQGEQDLKAAGAARTPGRTIVAVERHAGSRNSILWSDGSVSLVDVALAPELDERGLRRMKHVVRELGSVAPEGEVRPQTALVRRDEEGGLTCARLLPGNRILIVRQVANEDLFGDAGIKTYRTTLDKGIPGTITAIAMDTEGNTLYAGTDNGRLLLWELTPEAGIRRQETAPAFRDRRAITSLAMVFGDVSLAVGDGKGGLSSWFEVGRGRQRKLELVHPLRSHAGPVREIHPSQRNKSLLSLGGSGAIHLDHPTSERGLLSLDDPKTPLQSIAFSPRGDAAIALGTGGELRLWLIDSPHPEISWETLFGKVLYEGYDEPDYVWQTTGGADFEPKLSLVPIVFGTLKGTFYAMLLAVPLALLGAAYTSHFTTPGFKNAVKPVVEVMAAIPSVVIGFLVALWLAPKIEEWILGVFASMVTIPLVFVAFMLLWQFARRYEPAKRVENGYEFLVMLLVIPLGAALAFAAVPLLEGLVFDGNFKLWLYETMSTRYDQRNSIIIAFGLGFAVIPIIFSIAEDSLSSVPHSLTAASMALGASRWQTMWRVVLPSGSPGIFAGTMIGFGRAVGETMIVLMATGNTPILDPSPWNGMRTLSANIAVEIPEAPVGGTLYRVLFLCAVLLFLLTFSLNTAAELVRQRLRKRYGRL
ncbi:MAG: ABC transporter permease subunit [Pirellulales bacterium]|nr:ABC transporter permease subunit [Pirellulales bacterium]